MIDIEKVRLWSVSFTQDFHIEGLPYPDCIVEEKENRGYRMPMYAHGHIPESVGGQLTLTLAGRGTLKVAKRQFSLVPGTAFLYRDSDPTVSYIFPDDATQDWRFIWLNFPGEASSRIISRLNEHYGYFFSLCDNNLLRDTLLSFQKYAGRRISQTPLEGALFAMDFLMLLCESTSSTRSNSNETLIREIKNRISSAFDESISTSTLAMLSGISREHLSRTFHSETGQTLKDYRADQRMNDAVSMLLKTALSCKEIAHLAHFGSYSSFYRAFIRKYNLPPEMFRQQR